MTVTSVRRVTVVAPNVRVDVSLPLQTTVAELMPQLVRMCADGEQPLGLAGWELGRLGAPALESGSTVESAGVRDGEVLYLRARDRRFVPLLFDDVVDAIASAAERQPGAWRPLLSRRAALVAAAAAFGGVGLLLGLTALPGLWTALLAALLALALLIAGGALARAQGDAAAGAVLAAGGIPAALFAGARLFGPAASPLHPTAAQLTGGCAAAAVYGVLAAALVVDRSVWFVSTTAAASAGTAAAAVTLVGGVRAVATAAVMLALSVAIGPLLPAIALRLGKLPPPRIPTDVATFRSDESPTLGPEVVDGTLASRHQLTGLLAAVTTTAVCAAVVTLHTSNRWAWLLTGLTGLATALRSRAHAGTGPRIVLLIAGAGVVTASAARVAVDGDLRVRAAIAVAVLLVGTVCAAHALRTHDRAASPYWSRLLDVLEFLALVSLGPVTGAVIGVYALVRTWGG